MYTLSLADSGDIREVIEKNWSSLFVYTKDENINNIVGNCPLIYDSKEALLDFLQSPSGRRDLIEWLNKGYTLVIRDLNLIVNE